MLVSRTLKARESGKNKTYQARISFSNYDLVNAYVRRPIRVICWEIIIFLVKENDNLLFVCFTKSSHEDLATWSCEVKNRPKTSSERKVGHSNWKESFYGIDPKSINNGKNSVSPHLKWKWSSKHYLRLMVSHAKRGGEITKFNSRRRPIFVRYQSHYCLLKGPAVSLAPINTCQIVSVIKGGPAVVGKIGTIALR